MINKFKKGFTLVEVSIASGILALLGGILMYWFSFSGRQHANIADTTAAQQMITQANWKMINELRLSRNIMHPRKNQDGSIKSDTKLIFKNKCGEIVSYYYDIETKELRRIFIGSAYQTPRQDLKPIATNLDMVFFTNRSVDNRMVDIFLKSKNTFGLETVYLLNN